MDFLWKYWPLLMKIGDHRAEIERIQQLAAPTIAEVKKVWPELLPLLQKLAQLLTPAMTELRKVWTELWPLALKLMTGLSK